MFEQAFKNIDDVLRKEAGCTTELDYTEQSSWLLFLKYLDDLEEDRRTEAGPDHKGCRDASPFSTSESSPRWRH
jgi:type I restriction enzyme M protein